MKAEGSECGVNIHVVVIQAANHLYWCGDQRPTESFESLKLPTKEVSYMHNLHY